MQKLMLKNKTEIELVGAPSLSKNTTGVDTYLNLKDLADELSDDNLSKVIYMQDGAKVAEYNHMTWTDKRLDVTEDANGLMVTFGIREKTDAELIAQDAVKATIYLTDAQALSVKAISPKWEDDPDGYEYNADNPYDARRLYNDRLWHLKSNHRKQTDWFPGAAPTLWEEIVEGHDGTISDPIPVPDAVKTSGFTYEYGKHYSEGNDVYLARRTGKQDGDKETLYFPPSELVGSYFEKVG